MSSKKAAKRLERFLSEIQERKELELIEGKGNGGDTVGNSVTSGWDNIINCGWDDGDTGVVSEVAEDTIFQLQQVLEALKGGEVGLIEDVKGLSNTVSKWY